MKLTFLTFQCFLVLSFVTLTSQAQTIRLVFGEPTPIADKSVEINKSLAPRNIPITHRGYVLSYNVTRHSADWVAWHLSKGDMGPFRTNAFRADEILPPPVRVPGDTFGSTYDRGHMCPSEDRSSTLEGNRETFLMSNMQPQFFTLNRGIWKGLEGYVQTLVKKGQEAYLWAGCYGDLGKVNDLVTIPAFCWKIVLLLPEGSGDLRRANRNTRLIAVIMPNKKPPIPGWGNYRTTVRAIEQATGLDFLTELSPQLQTILETRQDSVSVR